MKQENNCILAAFTAGLLLATAPAEAYELATHARFSFCGYVQSHINIYDPTTLMRDEAPWRCPRARSPNWGRTTVT